SYSDPTGMWEVDMHLVGVYWMGRLAGATHRIAVRVALASQSLDDADATRADVMKRKQLFSSDFSGRGYRLPNNMHALGVTYAYSERVARTGIRKHWPLLFGLGLHTVGDFLAHANLSGNTTFGHQNGINEDGSDSRMQESDADYTYHNPRKALDTLAR